MVVEPGKLAVYKFACPHCGARKGEVCVKLSNFIVPAERTHRMRIKLVWATTYPQMATK